MIATENHLVTKSAQPGRLKSGLFCVNKELLLRPIETQTYTEIFLHTDCSSGQSVLLFTGGISHEQKKEAADLAGALRRQGRNRERIEESQTKGKDFAEPDLQANPKRQNPPTLHESRYVGELSAESRTVDE